jgi:hypothetical protein
MRFTRLLPVLFVPAIACGGGESKPPVPVDSTPVTPDSPAALECPPTGLSGAIAKADGSAVGLPPGACGADGMTPCDWYIAPEDGSNVGITELLLIIGVQDTMDQLQFHLATPIVANQAVNWETDATSTAAYQALAIYLQSQNGSSVDRILFPQSGSITATESNQAQNGITKGSISATTFAELDDDGAVLAGGCTSDITSLTFNLAQGSATFQKPGQGVATPGKPWMKIIPNGVMGQLYSRD